MCMSAVTLGRYGHNSVVPETGTIFAVKLTLTQAICLITIKLSIFKSMVLNIEMVMFIDGRSLIAPVGNRITVFDLLNHSHKHYDFKQDMI